jgi:hypothetical protein
MRALGLAISAGLFCAPALADANIAGHWKFEAVIENDCTFAGTAHLEKVAEDRFTGEVTAHQSCPMLPEDYLVRQDCSASQIGKQVSVRCHIAEFINGFESAFYYPDNFTLTIESSARMHGALVSAGRTRPAEWIRDKGGVS